MSMIIIGSNITAQLLVVNGWALPCALRSTNVDRRLPIDSMSMFIIGSNVTAQLLVVSGWAFSCVLLSAFSDDYYR
jgi:hypothetical protein